MMKLLFVMLLLWLTICVSGQDVTIEMQAISAANIGQLREISRLDIDSDIALVGRIVWTPDGQSFAIVLDNQVLLYNASDLNAEPVVLYETTRVITSATFSTDYALMAVASGVPDDHVTIIPLMLDAEVALVALDTGEIVSEFQTKHVATAIAFSHNNTRLIVVDYATYDFSIWNLEDSRLIELVETNQPGWYAMFPATFSDDATLLALGAGSTYNLSTIWNTQTGELVAEGEYGYSSELTFSPDNSILAGASRYGGYTQLWVLNGEHDDVHIHYNPFYMLASDFSPDGTIYAQIILAPTDSENGYKVDFFAPETGKRLYRIHVSVDPSWIMDVTFSPDGKWLLIYDSLNGIQLWGIPDDA